MNEIIWHYATGARLEKILKSGELQVSQWEIQNKVKPPALWLSLNPIWEYTATSMIKDDSGRIRDLSKDELHAMFGLIRFSIPFNRELFCSWAKYKYKSNTPLGLYHQMERDGIKQGANPKEWFASFKNIPLSKCISCEKWDGTKWVEYIKF
jgi:hypothetical protein